MGFADQPQSFISPLKIFLTFFLSDFFFKIILNKIHSLRALADEWPCLCCASFYLLDCCILLNSDTLTIEHSFFVNLNYRWQQVFFRSRLILETGLVFLIPSVLSIFGHIFIYIFNFLSPNFVSFPCHWNKLLKL